jgi:hypothetical protein
MDAPRALQPKTRVHIFLPTLQTHEDPAFTTQAYTKTPAFTRDLFGLKINQGVGGFRPYSERNNFLNCMNNTLPQMLDMVPKEGDTKRAFGSLSHFGSARIRSTK